MSRGTIELPDYEERLDRIERKVDQLLEARENQHSKPMTAQEAANLLHMSVSTLYRKAKLGLPCLKTGKGILFDEKDLYEWMKKNANGGTPMKETISKGG